MRGYIIGTIILILVLCGAAAYVIKNQDIRTSALPAALGDMSANATPDVPPPLSTSVPQTTEVQAGMREYQNAAFHFKIDYPDTLAATEYQESGNALTVTFVSADDSQSFEVYVTPYSGTQITQAEFKLDEPSGAFNDPTNVVIDGTQATMFYGSNPIMGDTREVWFIKGGFLYEVATYKQLDSWLGGIMQAWRFI